MTTTQRNFLQKLWDFFCSLKLTMFLLISLAIISIIGTIVPQGTPPPEYIAQISSAKLKLYKSLGFFDMYHSWWFILMLYLLTVNLVSCSIKRLPHIWKVIRQPLTVMNSSFEQTLSNRKSLKVDGEPSVVGEKLAAVLKTEFAEPTVTQVDGVIHLFAQKNPWCRLSVYFVHLSVIIIFIGAIIGSLFGYKAFVNINEGESVSKVMSRSGKEIDLGFSLRCDQFSLTRYSNGSPKEFKSILTVLENDRPVPDFEHARVIVNDPLVYKGITFYQSSYGNAGNYFFLLTDPDGNNEKQVMISATSQVTLPDGSVVRVLEAVPDVSPFIKGLSGAAAQLEIHSPSGDAHKIIAYANYPEFNSQQARENKINFILHYAGLEEKMYTGLQVAKDPGVWVVWLGCLLMVIGIYAAFFMSHRRVWVRIENGTVTIGGNTNKNQGGFAQSFDALAEKLAAQISREKK